MRLPLTSGCEGTCGQALKRLVFVSLPTTFADMELSIPQCFTLCFLNLSFINSSRGEGLVC